MFWEPLLVSQMVEARCLVCVSSPTERAAWGLASSLCPVEAGLECPRPKGKNASFVPAQHLFSLGHEQKARILVLDFQGEWRFWDLCILRYSSDAYLL